MSANFYEFLPLLGQFFEPKYLAEFAGTLLMLLFGCGSCANASLAKTKGSRENYFMVVTGWAVGVALVVFLFMRASGAHFNPAITLTFAFAGSFPWADVVPYCLAQFAGAFCGAAIAYAIYFKHFEETDDANAKLGVFCTIPAIRSPLGSFLAEMFGTAVLLFAITGLGFAARGADGAAAFDPGFSALCIGLLILAIGIALGGPTGFALNPARDLAPRFLHRLLPIPQKRDSDWGYAWVPIVAPMLGGPLGYALWHVIFGSQAIPTM